MKELFENLKQKREEKGISLEDINRKSRLSVNYLKAIEAGELEKLPSGYERIYLRRYAKEIGLNEDEVIRDYDLLAGRLTPAGSDTAPPDSKKETKQKPADSHPSQATTFESRPNFFENLNLDKINKIFWPSFGALVFLILVYIVYQQFIADEGDENLAIKEITIAELMEKSQSPDSMNVPIPVKTTTVADGNAATTPQMQVELNCKERVWVREVRDSRDTTEYILDSGNRRSIEAVQQVQFLIGRADGIEIWLNGQNLGLMGEADEVALLILTPTGIVQKRVRKVQPQNAESRTDSSIVTNTSRDSL